MEMKGRSVELAAASSLALACASCYSPHYGDCQISCANGLGCPADLQCDNQSMCRLPGMTQACGSPRDGGSDSRIDANFDCWSGVVPPSNFRPCDPDFPATGPVISISTMTPFDTDNGTFAGTSAPGGPYTTDGGGDQVWLVHAASVTIGATLRVTGSRSLLIVSDGAIDIHAVIDDTIANRSISAACENGMGQSGSANAGGGGGGGNGGPGGDG